MIGELKKFGIVKMDTNSRYERFSLNATNVVMPIAESTCINFNGSKLDKTRNMKTDLNSPPTGFETRDALIHKKYRTDSNDCLSNDYSQRNYGWDVRGKQCSMGQQRINTKIDPRIYTDVQSKGLVTRIVKYHEKGTRLNRSLSTSNAYTKPGQFPNVNLKKVELPQRAISRNLSMTRIAPPEKSLFYGNTLPGILRSNSVATMQKSDDEISSENRPILHPPQTRNELAPTRSVLEALKEISRKRINSEQLDPKNNLKKYCNRTINEPERITPNIAQQQNKRQREHFNMPSLQPQPSLMAAQYSPEQMPKKRLCSYNNDITSSLSSSQLHANKRKLYESKNNSQRIVDSTSSSDENGCVVSIPTALPPTDERLSPSTTNANNLNKTTQNISSTERNEPVHAFNHVTSECGRLKSTPTKVANSPVPQAVSKKKITLFNRDYDDCKDTLTVAQHAIDGGGDELFNDVGFSAIPFVKPKKDISILKNPMIERTQKSKLALMLSGLRGDLYNDEDQWDIKGKLSGRNSSKCQHNKAIDYEAETEGTTKVLETRSNHSASTTETNKQPTLASTQEDTVKISSSAQPFVATVLATNSNPFILTTAKSCSQQLTTASDNASSPKELKTSVSKASSPLVGGGAIKLKTNAAAVGFSSAIHASTEGTTTTPKISISENNSIITTTTTTLTFSPINNITTTTTTTPKIPPIFGTSNSTNCPSSLGLTNSIPASNGAAIQSFGTLQSVAVAPGASLAFSPVSSTVTSAGKNDQPKTSASASAAVKSNNNNNTLDVDSTVDSVSKTNNALNFGKSPVSSSAVLSGLSSTPSFSFGIKPSAAAAPFSFNTTAPQISNSFSFGGALAKTSIPANETINSALATNTTIASSKLTFGESAQPTNSSSTSSASITNNNAFGFSFTNTNTNVVQPTAADTTRKDQSSLFAFGANSSAVVGAVSPIKQGGFLLGSAPLAAPTNSNQKPANIFNPSITKADTLKPIFSFGAVSSSANTTTNTTTTKTLFQPTTIAASSSGTNNGNNFGSGAGWQNKTFTFGSVNNSNNNNSTNQPTNMPEQNTSGRGFSFNADAKHNSAGFSFNSATNTVPSNGTSNRPPTFNFGSSALQDPSKMPAKSFPSSSNSSNNIFANVNVSKSMAPTNTFNFANASSPSSAAANSSSNANNTAPSQQSTASSITDRPFRRATRRLQKS